MASQLDDLSDVHTWNSAIESSCKCRSDFALLAWQLPIGWGTAFTTMQFPI